MLGTYFYHEILRKTVIAFGTLFNEVHIQKEDKSGNTISDLKVPLAYGPRSKFLKDDKSIFLSVITKFYFRHLIQLTI